MPRNATQSGGELAPPQTAALASLLTGCTVTAAAEAAAVDRSTLHRWLREDYTFQAAYNRGRRELHEAAATGLLVLAEDAAAALRQGIRDGNVPAALAVLKGLGLLAGQAPLIGSDDTAVLRPQAELRDLLALVS